MATASNNSRNRYQQRLKHSHLKWDFYDAQPSPTKRLFQDFPENLWPASYDDHASGFAEAHKRYLANLKNIWGPDHPAVIDAARRVSTRRSKIVELANADDLLSDF
jgi:hypothetical protein